MYFSHYLVSCLKYCKVSQRKAKKQQLKDLKGKDFIKIEIEINWYKIKK
jgi:hypothetical protein